MRLPLNSLLDSGGRVTNRTGRGRIGHRTADLFEEAEDVAHAVLDLRVAQAVARHGHELLRPQVNDIGDFAGGHDDSTGESEAVILLELVLFHAAVQKDVSVVVQGRWLGLRVDRADSLRLTLHNLVCREEDTLAKEVGQDIVSANKLYAPVERV